MKQRAAAEAEMEIAEPVNDDVRRRLCCVSPWKRRRCSRYPTVTVTRLMRLMMFYCFIRAAAAAHQSKTVAMAADDAGVRTPSDSVEFSASLSSAVSENVGRGRSASLPRRDDSSGRDRHGAASWRSLIAVRRLVGPVSLARPGGTGERRAAAPEWPGVVNNATLAATTTGMAAGVRPPTTAGVNVAPVITTPRGLPDRLPRIQIRSTSPHSGSPFVATYRNLGTSLPHGGNSYLPASAPGALIVDSGAVGNSVEQLSNDVYPVRSKSTSQSQSDSANKSPSKTTAADDVSTMSDSSEKDASLEPPGGGRFLHRRKRDRGVESVDKVDQEVQQSGSGSQLNATAHSADERTSTESSVLRTSEVDVQAGVSVRAGALRYRSRGNLAALVDPLKSGRASASVGSASASKWRQLATAGDNSTSPSPVTEETTSSPATRATSHGVSSNDSDSIEVKVLTLHVGANDSADSADSVFVAILPLNDSLPLNGSKALNSSLAPSGEWKCSKAVRRLGLRGLLRLRLSASEVAVCVYALSFLFALVAAWSITGIVYSLCVRNQRPSSPPAGRPSQLVLGLVATAAVARALHYVAVEYQLLATVATPVGRRAIYECWFPFVVAACFVHRRLLHAEAATKENERGHRIGFRCDACVVLLALCFSLTLVVLLCLLIEFCFVPVEAIFVLRLAFTVFLVLLSAANIHTLAKSSAGRRRVSTQVAFCALFGFLAVHAAVLLIGDFALSSSEKNADVSIAVEAAGRMAELFVSTLLCAHSSSTFFGIRRRKGLKNVSVERKEVPTKNGEKKVVSQTPVLPAATIKRQTSGRSWLKRLLDVTSKKSKVVDVGSAPLPISLGVAHSVCWASKEDPATAHGVSPPLPPPSRVKRSRSMLYNDHGFIRFRLDGDTDGESDARTLDDDDGGGLVQARSAPASEYASADDLSLRRGLSSAGTPHWSRPGSPSLTGFRAPSIHLQDSIDRALDRCDIWRVGCEQGHLNVDDLRRIVQLYADVSDCRRGYQQRRTAGITSINYAEV